MPIIEITDLNAEGTEVFGKLTESQLRNRLEPQKGIFIAESEKVITLALNAGYEPLSLLMERKHIEGNAREIIARCGDIPLYTASREVLSGLTGFELTRGIMCAMRRPPPKTAEEVCKNAKRIAVLENITDSTNIGAIFRSAAALGIEGILLTPSCCDPLYRRSVRVSMGTVLLMPYAIICKSPGEWLDSGVKRISEMGFVTAAMALREDSVSISHPMLKNADRLALIFGTEGDGLAEETIANADYCVKIPMSMGVDSLNVAAASAVAFWATSG
ncbi:MAG: RNA methyltransferase [Ruminococcus sp.]|nr:RNA methyltransferase [Ruminococcus sp.]